MLYIASQNTKTYEDGLKSFRPYGHKIIVEFNFIHRSIDDVNKHFIKISISIARGDKVSFFERRKTQEIENKLDSLYVEKFPSSTTEKHFFNCRNYPFSARMEDL